MSQSLPTFHAAVASVDAYGLGEGPVWDGERQRVLWVDINAGRVLMGTLDAGFVTPVEQLDFDGTVGAVACSTTGELIVAGQRRILYVDPNGARRSGVQVIDDDRGSRLNDGGCDPAGRFLVGSLAQDGRHGGEVLVRVEADAITVIDDDLTLSNGLAWSPDSSLMYSIDTTPGIVWARSYDADGRVGPRRQHLLIDDGGKPDGLCVDANGNLWIAVWGAGQVRCYSSAGDHLATVEVPAPHTTSAAFVGPGLTTLLITTARDELAAHELARFPESGRLFTAEVGVAGLAVAPWSGR